MIANLAARIVALEAMGAFLWPGDAIEVYTNAAAMLIAELDRLLLGDGEAGVAA